MEVGNRYSFRAGVEHTSPWNLSRYSLCPEKQPCAHDPLLTLGAMPGYLSKCYTGMPLKCLLKEICFENHTNKHPTMPE